jgi:hypothetical protein
MGQSAEEEEEREKKEERLSDGHCVCGRERGGVGGGRGLTWVWRCAVCRERGRERELTAKINNGSSLFPLSFKNI